MKWYAKTWIVVVAIILSVCLVVLFHLLMDGDGIVHAEDIETHARTFQNIPDEWLSETSIGDEVAVLVFYPPDSSDAVYSVYCHKRNGGFGYSFRAGGKISSVKSGITRFRIDGCAEYAYVSLNVQKINKLIVDDGSNPSTIPLDSSRPFAIVLPLNAGNIFFYDMEGNKMEIVERNL